MKKNGFTLIELLLCVAIVGILAAALFMAGCSRTDSEAANKAAQEYATHFKNVTGVECANVDSDHDGYVSCTLFRGSEDPLPIQCGAEKYCLWNCARGCKYTPFAGGSKARQ